MYFLCQFLCKWVDLACFSGFSPFRILICRNWTEYRHYELSKKKSTAKTRSKVFPSYGERGQKLSKISLSEKLLLLQCVPSIVDKRTADTIYKFGVTLAVLNNILQTGTELTDIDEEFLQLPSLLLTVTNFTFHRADFDIK